MQLLLSFGIMFTVNILILRFIPKWLFKSILNTESNACISLQPFYLLITLFDCAFKFNLKTRPATLLKNRLWHMCFLVNFAKFLRTPSLIEHLRWMLLDVLRTSNLRPVSMGELALQMRLCLF